MPSRDRVLDEIHRWLARPAPGLAAERREIRKALSDGNIALHGKRGSIVDGEARSIFVLASMWGHYNGYSVCAWHRREVELEFDATNGAHVEH